MPLLVTCSCSTSLLHLRKICSESNQTTKSSLFPKQYFSITLSTARENGNLESPLAVNNLRTNKRFREKTQWRKVEECKTVLDEDTFAVFEAADGADEASTLRRIAAASTRAVKIPEENTIKLNL